MTLLVQGAMVTVKQRIYPTTIHLLYILLAITNQSSVYTVEKYKANYIVQSLWRNKECKLKNKDKTYIYRYIT